MTPSLDDCDCGRKLKPTLSISLVIDKRRHHIPGKTLRHRQVYVNQRDEKLRHKNTAGFPASTLPERSAYVPAQT